MNTKNSSLYRILVVGIILALLVGSIPGIKAMAQDVQPEATPVATFADVPASHWAFSYIETLYAAGITSGCGTSPLAYCPTNPVTRAQMAKFLLLAEHGKDYVPPAAKGTVFSDVPASQWAAAWIEQLAVEGITSGCTADMYCPNNPVTRAQMAIFLLKTQGVAEADLLPATGVFSDVPTSHWAAAWIEELSRQGITSGCTSSTYCPQNSVTRAQMAVFLTKAFNLADPRGVAAEDFGAMNLSGVVGYTVGFHLVDSTYAEVESVVVNLYNGTTLLATNTAAPKFFTELAAASQASSPFDVLGTFDYAADGYWMNSGWSSFTSVIPDKAEIVVTFKNGMVRTAENVSLTGDTSIFTKGDVAPEDFSVMNVSGVVGYNVGFHLVDATYADATSVVVNLYNGTTLLATNTATPKFFTDFAGGTIQSSPFDVLGSFDYVNDGYWMNSGWNGFTSVLPDKAEIVVTFKNGLIKTATNTLRTGDTSIFTKGDVAAQDFGVYIYDPLNLKGYTVGFGLVDALVSDTTDIVVKLYHGADVMATATATSKIYTDFAGNTQLSAPFDVTGSFDYDADGYWTYSGWLGNAYDIPDKAEITVTFKNGLIKTATNTNVTGDTFLFDLVISDIHISSDNPIPTQAKLGDIISLSFTANQPVTKLGNFKINGSNPDTFTNVGNVYTATHLVDGGDPITGSPATFQINVQNSIGVYSQTLNTTTDGSSVTIVEPIGAIDYFSGIAFARTMDAASTTSGTQSVVQTVNPDGSVTISVTSADNEYIDSGFIKSIGTLGQLDSITVKGTGDFSFNLYFDVDKDGEYFLWNPDGTWAGVGADRYALFQGPYGPTLFANGLSNFGLIGGSPYVNTLDQLKAIFPADTPVGIWIGVTRGSDPAGTKMATIQSITVTTVP